jgi:hypothetical protein
MALLTPIPTSQHVETTQRLETIDVQEFKYPLGMTVSDDENDLAAVEEFYYRAGFDYQPAGPAPGGYFEPIGKFKKEEEVKAYHMMFLHIIGEDGLCVYPHCRQPATEGDFDRAQRMSDRYFNCFQGSFEELERSRIELQDAEIDRVLMTQKIPKSKSPVPPDPIGIPIPRPYKKCRRPKIDKRRARAISAALCSSYETAAHHSVLYTPQSMDLISNEVPVHKSSPMAPDVAHLQVPNPGVAPYRDPSSLVTALFSGPDPIPDPHLHPHPKPHPHPHHTPPYLYPHLPSLPSPSLSSLNFLLPSLTQLTPPTPLFFSPPSVFVGYDDDEDSDDCESDDGYTYM